MISDEIPQIMHNTTIYLLKTQQISSHNDSIKLDRLVPFTKSFYLNLKLNSRSKANL